MFWKPVWLFRVLGLPVLSRDALFWLETVWKLSLLTSALGVFTRTSTGIAFVLGTYLLGLQNSFGKIHHADAILVFTMAILALSRCGDAWSVDRWIWSLRRHAPDPVAPSGEYTWPIRAVWLAMSCVFFAAGVSKLRHSGMAWVTSDSLGMYFVWANYGVARLAAPPLTTWGIFIARTPWLVRVLAAASLAIELFFPLAMVSRRARAILLPAVLGLQFGISLLMLPFEAFGRFMVCYVFWIPWDRVGTWVKNRMSAKRKHALMFDGACGLCQRTVAVLRRLDVGERIAFLDALNDWTRVHHEFPTLTQEQCLETMHVVTPRGRVHTGFDAYRALAWSVPVVWPAAPFLYLPGVPWVGRRVYARVAARRHRLGCPVPSRGAPPVGGPGSGGIGADDRT